MGGVVKVWSSTYLHHNQSPGVCDKSVISKPKPRPSELSRVRLSHLMGKALYLELEDRHLGSVTSQPDQIWPLQE